MHTFQRADGVADVVVRVRRRERQRQHFRSRTFGDGQRRLIGKALAVVREAVHRQEVNRRGDVLLGERPLVVITRRPRSFGGDFITLIGPAKLHGIEANLLNMPDMAQTLVDYNSQSAAYQAALRAGANIVQTSLMDFLK